ncbi:MAG: DnaJ domain-containing protein [Alkalispirochaeta sp.]
MKRFLGRVIGLSIGALAGPVGAVFGFLAGWLVDQFRHALGPWWRVQRFLAYPYQERRWEYVEEWGTAAILIDVLRADGPPRVVQVERALREPWPRMVPSRGRRGIPRRSLIDLCLRELPRINQTAILEVLRSWDDVHQSQLLHVLVAVACADSHGMSSAELTVIRTVAQAFSRPIPPWHGLDRHACTLLGVSPDADEATVRRAFRTLAAELHPDTGGDLDPEQRQTMGDAFVRIRQAHDRLIAQIQEWDDPRKTS